MLPNEKREEEEEALRISSHEFRAAIKERTSLSTAACLNNQCCLSEFFIMFHKTNTDDKNRCMRSQILCLAENRERTRSKSGKTEEKNRKGSEARKPRGYKASAFSPSARTHSHSHTTRRPTNFFFFRLPNTSFLLVFHCINYERATY